MSAEAKLLWEYFEILKEDAKFVHCKLCYKKLSRGESNSENTKYNSENTKPFNLTRHLKRRHNEEHQKIVAGAKKGKFQSEKPNNERKDGTNINLSSVKEEFKYMNPWAVDDVSVFLKYNCPQCEFNHLDLQSFTNHALENHAESIALFSSVETTGDPLLMNIKIEEKEVCENCDNYAFECVCSIDIPTDPIPDSEVEEENSFSIKKEPKKKSTAKNKKKVNSSEKQVICEICPIHELAPLAVVKSHRFEKHMQGDKIMCLYCDYKPKVWSALLLHFDTKHPDHDEKKLSCRFCKKSFLYEKSFKAHYCHANKKGHICDICGFECKKLFTFKEHMLLKHNHEAATKLVCEQCGFSTVSKEKLRRHTQLKHRIDAHKQCPYCSYKSPSGDKLNIHIDNHHPETAEKKFFCDKCSKGFIYKETHTRHYRYLCKFSDYIPPSRKAQSMSIKFKVQCEYCPEILNTEHRLKRHYQDHHSDKPIEAAGFTKFNCDLCKEFFFAKNSLDVHLNRKHGIDNGIVEPEKRRFHCTQCPGNYYSYQALRNHIVRAHDGIRYECNECDKTFAGKDAMKSHIKRVHEKRQDFLCKPCRKYFGSHKDLKGHTDQCHSQVTCEICNKEISNPFELKKHRVFVHKETEGAWICRNCPRKVFFTQFAYDKHKNEKH